MRRAPCLPIANARALATSVRTIIACKGVVENRIEKHYSNRTVEEAKAEREAQIAKVRHPNPRNRKEELSHLTQHCGYEYVPEFQRWANDMMAVYSDPQGYGHDMAYHYHRIWKAKSPTRRGIEDGSGAFEMLSTKMDEFSKRMQDLTEMYNSYEQRRKYRDYQAHDEQRELSQESNVTLDDSSTFRSCSAPMQASPSDKMKRISVESLQHNVSETPERIERELPEETQLLNPANETFNREVRSFSETAEKQISPVSPRRASKTSPLEETPSFDSAGSKDALETDRINRIDFQQEKGEQEKGVDVEVSKETNDVEDSDSSIEFVMEDSSPAHVSKSPVSSNRCNKEAISSSRYKGHSSSNAGCPPQSDEARSPSSKILSITSHAAPPHRGRRLSKDTNADTASHNAPSAKVGPWLSSQTRRASSPSRRSSAMHSCDNSPRRSVTQIPPSRSSACSYDRPSSNSSRVQTPLRRPTGRRGELFDHIEQEMTALREDILVRNLQIESAMLRDPFTRLYHMNNRRDRDERRGRLHQYKRLEAAKEQLLADSDSDVAVRRRIRREMGRDGRDEFFARLYQPSPPRHARNHSPTPTRRGRRTQPADDATFQRLYEDGMESMAARAERERRAAEECEQREVREMLRTRILARVELESPRCARTAHQRDARVASIERSLVHDPKKLRAFLSPRQVTKEEEALVAWRLSHHGYISAQKLAEKKAEEELKFCTFHPRTNSPQRSRGCSASKHSYGRDTTASSARRQREESASPSAKMNSSMTQKRACEMLYLRATKQRESREALIASAEREKRLSFLKSKLREDHHFRRRVELDPSLAERYMASLVL